MLIKSQIQGENISLRNLAEEDVPIMTQWINDPGVSRYLQVELPVTEEYERAWVQDINASQNDQVFGIIEKSTNTYIGNVGIHDIKKESGVATVGIFIGNKSKQGKGYGREAIELVTDFAFDQLRIQKLQAPIFLFNQRSIAIFEKAGFLREAAFLEKHIKNGEHQDTVLLVRINTHLPA